MTSAGALLSDHLQYKTHSKDYRKEQTPYKMQMPGTNSTKAAPVDPKEKWIAYRENGEVKYMRESEATDFTSAGGAAKHHTISGFSSMPGGGVVGNNPNLLPERYTDDSIIAVIVTNVVPAIKSEAAPEKKSSFLSKLKPSRKEPETTKAVWMPRGAYKKWFAKDNAGNYIGTEPQREWTEEELEDEFGQYHKDMPPMKRNQGASILF